EAIETQVAGTDGFVQDAHDLAGDVTRRMNQLTQAVDRIAGIVAVIGTIARQTNLLALNASIEAARAGPAGRGFAVVATEVKALAGQVQSATGDIGAQIKALQSVAQESGATVESIAALLGRVGPVLDSMRDAVATQIGGAREVAHRAAESLQFVSIVSQKSEAMTRLASEARTSSQEAGAAAAKMAPSLRRLTHRATAILRHADSRDRRGHTRVPVQLAGSFRVFDGQGKVYALQTLDLSPGGALVHADPPLPPDARGFLEIDGIGTVQAVVRSHNAEDGTRVRFETVPENVIASIDAMVVQTRARYRPLVKTTQAFATEIMAAFEDGIANGRTRFEDLLTVDYRRIPESDPIQFTTAATAFYDSVLPPILERFRRDIPGVIMAIAADRNAYLPVHHPEYSQPQRPGAHAWNDVSGRNRRILERSKMLILARNSESYRLSVFMRHTGGNDFIPATIVAAPILVCQQLWGNAMIAIDLRIQPAGLPASDNPETR
ncbi:MAG: methyl-accepting chemotaxis protein, partial [Alsobacter sp.]